MFRAHGVRVSALQMDGTPRKDSELIALPTGTRGGYGHIGDQDDIEKVVPLMVRFLTGQRFTNV